MARTIGSARDTSTVRTDSSIMVSRAGVRSLIALSPAEPSRAKPSSMTARASSSLEAKWKYSAPLVTPDCWMISLRLALA